MIMSVASNVAYYKRVNVVLLDHVTSEMVYAYHGINKASHNFDYSDSMC